MSRQYASGGRLAPNHLESLAHAACFNASTAEAAAEQHAHTNLLLQATAPGEMFERRQQRERNAKGSGGRTLQDSIVFEDGENAVTSSTNNDGYTNAGALLSSVQFGAPGRSILHHPTLIAVASSLKITKDGDPGSDQDGNDVILDGERSTDPPPTVDLQATKWEAARQAASTMREFLDVRERVRSLDQEMRSIQASLSIQQEITNRLDRESDTLNHDSTISDTEKTKTIEEINEKKQGCDRVISQLQRKLSELTVSLDSNRRDLRRLETKARSQDEYRKSISRDFYDPLESWRGTVAKGSKVGGNFALRMVLGRQRGSSLPSSRGTAGSFFAVSLLRSTSTHFREIRKNLLETQLSHAVTIHTHSQFPVFCLRFDQTGRYFISGADDFLVKIFCIGAGKSSRKRTTRGGSKLPRCNYGANVRGAVLVCTLRGHTGVINDINVSPDNSLVATSSDDGDVRIWGLKDGCPVAILRGHKGGANGVSWSTLSPCRLFTIGSDGVTRAWDIRDACLNRYGSQLGHRAEYKLQLTDEEEKVLDALQQGDSLRLNAADRTNAVAGVLSPLPGLPGEGTPGGAPLLPPLLPPPLTAAASGGVARNGIVVPPLPAAVPPLGEGADANEGVANLGNGNQPGHGAFVANDTMDEGVKLLSKYQHGSTRAVSEQQQGSGTRSRRAAVQITCISHCPLGRQFITGTDDGICRVWETCDDERVEIVDGRHQSKLGPPKSPLSLRQAKPEVQRDPLLKLMGHLNAITDLAYAHAGDRVLSASEKDGVVRVWSIGVAPARDDTRSFFKNRRVTQIVIKLTNPSAEASSSYQRNRRRPGGSARNSTPKVYCNSAVWTHDDSKVITSQCILKKESSNDIQPGSQFLFMWDSKSGCCLIGIAGAHQMQCNVVIPHPFDDSIACTAGGDGRVKIWDWARGKCLFTHENKAMHTSNESGKGGYLDGSFSPDGTTIVLTDDAGQVALFDSISEEENPLNAAPAWMREQYFADDYYEMEYNENGHCFDQRSGRPPHLAPRAARCNYSASSYSEEIYDTFRGIQGPLPLPEDICRWNRDSIRKKRLSHGNAVAVAVPDAKMRVGVREFDSRVTIIIRGEGYIGGQGKGTKASHQSQDADDPAAAAESRRNSRMSQNFNYLSYEDLMRQEEDNNDDEPESEDEEFEPTAPRARRARNSDDESDDDGEDLDDMSLESGADYRRRRRGQAEAIQRRNRADRRARRLHQDFVEMGSEDELAQFCTANTTPNGPYVRDFSSSGHLWRLKKTDVRKVHRKWLRRPESDTSYNGQKIYTPQVGDSVVYIPRAHLETIDDYPSFTPPWQTWPQEAEWPVVRCFVRATRFRFPYDDYFRSGQTSIVAILTLEVTGIPECIPELSEGRHFPWPKPTFVEPARPFVFELSVFENGNSEYVIPEMLYTARLNALERNLLAREAGASGLQVDLYYDNGRSLEDAMMEPWPASITAIENNDDRQDVHLRGSGFGAITVHGNDGYSDTASPWELNAEGANLARPTMSEEDKESVLEALKEVVKDEIVSDHLTRPVNLQQYYDYETMVEVSLDTMFIKRRINENYYNSKLGVVADLRLVRDNCIKYNTAQNDISEAAIRMCAEFEEKVLASDELAQLLTEEDFDKMLSEQAEGVRAASSLRIRISTRGSTSLSSSNGNRYSLRDRSASARSSGGESTLERLPPPPQEAPSPRRTVRSAGPTRRLRSNGTDVLNRLGATNRIGRGSRSANPRYRDVANSDAEVDDESDVAAQRNMRRQAGRGRSSGDRGGRSLRSRDAAAPNVQGNRSTDIRSSSRYRDSNDEGDDGLAASENESEADEEVGVRRRTRTAGRSREENASDNEDEEEEEGDEEEEEEEAEEEQEYASAPRSGTTRGSSGSQRLTRGNLRGHDDEFGNGDASDDSHGSGEEDQDDSTELTMPRRRSASGTRTDSRRASSAPENSSPGRRSGRTAAQIRTSYEEVDSDMEMGEDESADDQVAPRAQPSRCSSNGRKTRRSHTTPQSSDEDDSEEAADYSDAGSLNEDSKERTQRNQRKRKGDAKPDQQPKSKKKAKIALPDLKKWPEIAVKDISKVTNDMLQRIRNLDVLQLFSIPVLETFPDMENDYLNVIEQPMDLRTIEEEQMYTYDSIVGLQEDLILIFRNCCTFNNDGDEYWKHSVGIWGQLNEVFLSSCTELGVLLPRRWTP